MTLRKRDDCRIRGIPGRGRAAAALRVLAAGLGAALMLLAAGPMASAPGAAAADAAAPIKIAVFDFVLDDRSAGGGIIAPDPIDTENLAKSTDEARRRLMESGRYSIVDTADAADALAAAGGVRHCNGCDGPLAGKLGADQSMVGIVTRVTRTEYTMQIVVRDAATGEVISNSFTGLRMGANYSWPRGAKWLMENRVLEASAE